jgi:excisionase family DNA binding protein
MVPDTNTEMERRTLLDIEGVAARLGVTVRHVRRLVADRRIPYLKWGHLLRFDPAEIEAWLDEARRPVRSLAVGVPALRIRRGDRSGLTRWPSAGAR